MRLPRLKVTPLVEGQSAFYHCVTRTIGRKFILGDREKDDLLKLMWEYQRFSEVRILTYCLMTDHFHLLLEVPPRPGKMLDDQELLAKVRRIPGQNQAALIEKQLTDPRGGTEAAEAIRRRVSDRMYDMGGFMKPLKQRFTQEYNLARGRRGTLWDERYKSVVVEGTGRALSIVAAYIDLNPVRAGLARDPQDYRWCGYAAALGGETKPREGLKRVMAAATGETLAFKEALAGYQELLFGPKTEGGETPSSARLDPTEFSPERVADLIEQRARLSLADYLRMRVRYFTDGVAVGSRDFVNGVFAAHRGRFSAKRKDGARQMRLVDSEDLFCLRDLQLQVFGKPQRVAIKRSLRKRTPRPRGDVCV